MTDPMTSTDRGPALRLERHASVGRILLDRPDALNAIDLGSARLLLRAVLELDADPACSVIVVESTGRAFCTGGDVSAIMSAPRPDHYLRDLATTAAEAFHLLETTGAGGRGRAGEGPGADGAVRVDAVGTRRQGRATGHLPPDEDIRTRTDELQETPLDGDGFGIASAVRIRIDPGSLPANAAEQG